MNKTTDFSNKNNSIIKIITIIIFIVLFILPFATTKRVSLDGKYTSKEEVALYVMEYHELPSNYITKDGYKYMKNHNIDTKGYIIGGDTHINEGQFETFDVNNIQTLKECDIVDESYSLTNRGKKRIVYTCNNKNVKVFYTDDHYENYEEITHFELQLTRNIFWIIFGVYLVVFISIHIVLSKAKKVHELSWTVSIEDFAAIFTLLWLS